MDLISKYLEKFKKIKDPKEDKLVVVGIFNEFKLPLSLDQIDIRNNNVYISNISPVYKNHIFINKAVILSKINESLPSLKIQDIL